MKFLTAFGFALTIYVVMTAPLIMQISSADAINFLKIDTKFNVLMEAFYFKKHFYCL
jgi:hypothetical protein